MQTVLGQVLAKAINLQENPDLHDRALLYYRLLQTDVREAAKIVQTPQDPPLPIMTFAEDESFENMERVFQEFNTLSVVYGKPAEAFIITKPQKFERPPVTPNHPPHADSNFDNDNASASNLRLNSQASLDPGSFQEIWGSLEPSAGFDLTIARTPTDQMISELLVRHGVVRLASGVVGDTVKVYLYSQEESTGELLLIEVLGNTTSLQLSANIKSNAPPDIVVQFAESCREWLQ